MSSPLTRANDKGKNVINRRMARDLYETSFPLKAHFIDGKQTGFPTKVDIIDEKPVGFPPKAHFIEEKQPSSITIDESMDVTNKNLSSSKTGVFSRCQFHYKEKIIDHVLLLEREDASFDIPQIIERYFPQGYYHIPIIPGKCQQYYESILLETNSVDIQHSYKHKKEIAFSRLKIKQILHLNQWCAEGDPYVPRKMKNQNFPNQYYNYWDYQDAWEYVFYFQNQSETHSWFVRFTFQTNVPIWYTKIWKKFGASREIFPKKLKDFITEKSGIQEELNILYYCSQYGIPWIVRWELYIENNIFPHFLGRKIFLKWWDSFNLFDVTKGQTTPKLVKSKKGTYAQQKLELSKKLQLKYPSASEDALELMVFRELSKDLIDDSTEYLLSNGRDCDMSPEGSAIGIEDLPTQE